MIWLASNGWSGVQPVAAFQIQTPCPWKVAIRLTSPGAVDVASRHAGRGSRDGAACHCGLGPAWLAWIQSP